MRHQALLIGATSEPQEPAVADNIVEYPVVSQDAPFQPRRQFYVGLLMEGKTLAIHQREEYHVFFRLFTRACSYRRLKMNLSLRQVDPDLWHLIPWKRGEKKPGSLLRSAFRKHGRYRFFVAELKRGQKLEVTSEDEVQRIRLGFNRYISKRERRRLELRSAVHGRHPDNIAVWIAQRDSEPAVA